MVQKTTWGLFAKLTYKLVLRKWIVKAVIATDNTLDDRVVRALDVITGYKGK